MILKSRYRKFLKLWIDNLLITRKVDISYSYMDIIDIFITDRQIFVAWKKMVSGKYFYPERRFLKKSLNILFELGLKEKIEK
jgi:hypothetical protein